MAEPIGLSGTSTPQVHGVPVTAIGLDARQSRPALPYASRCVRRKTWRARLESNFWVGI
jgi:hypothetical protein